TPRRPVSGESRRTGARLTHHNGAGDHQGGAGARRSQPGLCFDRFPSALELQMETPDTIHAVWFGTHTDDDAVIASQSALWWRKQAEVDAEIRRRFAPWVARAASGELDGWLADIRGRLALI